MNKKDFMSIVAEEMSKMLSDCSTEDSEPESLQEMETQEDTICMYKILAQKLGLAKLLGEMRDTLPEDILTPALREISMRNKIDIETCTQLSSSPAIREGKITIKKSRLIQIIKEEISSHSSEVSVGEETEDDSDDCDLLEMIGGMDAEELMVDDEEEPETSILETVATKK